MGIFRLSGKLELSCFVGAKLQGAAGVKTQYKPTETPAGATALLGTPTMEVGPSGYIGVKCEAFAGAQAGGALSGPFEWIEPEKQGTGKVVVSQANASNNWAKLAEIKAEGNVAVGFGAGGGFGTVVDLEQVGKLTLLFCNALADMDYRHLLGVTEEAFSYMASGLYRVATSPAKTFSDAFEDGVFDMALWWDQRKATRVEAEALADYLIAHEKDKVMGIREQDVPLSVLPPETIGPMVYLLTEGVIARGD